MPVIDEDRETDGRAWVALMFIWLRWPLRQALRLWCWLTDGKDE